MPVTAQAIATHMQQIGHWVDWNHTCDGFKAGDPDAPIRGIAVGWQSLSSSLSEAAALGCNLFVTHEPTFYSHMDDDETLKVTAPALAKRDWLDRTGMVVYRCHDVWDLVPGGVADAWAAHLELGPVIASEGYNRLVEAPPVPAWELALQVTSRTREFGEHVTRFVGDRSRVVSRVALGTGAATKVREMVAMGADAVVASDDGTTLWSDAAWMADLGVPLILVNHAVSEMPGMRTLAAYLRERFDVPVHLVGPTCQFQLMEVDSATDDNVFMRRDTLGNLPEMSLPEGFTLRDMAPDEVWAYLRVMNGSCFAGTADVKWFERTFCADPLYDPSYVQIIWEEDDPVAAAAAWHTTIDDKPWGMVHWVGVCRSHRHLGLGKAISAAVLYKLCDRGFTRAVLGTQTWRLPAIAAYLRLGFVPDPRHEDSRAMWDETIARLERWRCN